MGRSFFNFVFLEVEITPRVSLSRRLFSPSPEKEMWHRWTVIIERGRADLKVPSRPLISSSPLSLF